MTHSAHSEKTIFGFRVYLMSDCVLFAALFAVYAVLHTASFGGPTPYELFRLPYVFTETMFLLPSSFTMGLATIAAYNHRKNLTIALIALTLLLGWSFLGMEISEFSRMVAGGHGPGTSAFLSGYFGLVGTHGLHVALGSLALLITTLYIAGRGLTDSNIRKLTLLGLFWHFLDIVWIFIFTFVYLFGLL